MKTIKVGTRGSRLAIRQTELMIEQLRESCPEAKFEIIEIKTTGDKFLDVTLDKIGGKGLFTKEIEEALLRGEIDMAVHSLKDMPGELHEAFTLAAFSRREDPSDSLISRNGEGLDSLPKGALVGTSSLRRVCQLKALRPDLQIEPLRGNIVTRMKKLEEGQFDAIVLATAGIVRLGMKSKITQRLDTELFIPAVSQGIICVETGSDRADMLELLKVCDDQSSRTAAACERAYLKRLNGNCKIPVGAYCTINGNELEVVGMLGDEGSLRVCREKLTGSVEKAEELGNRLADILREKMEKNS